MIHKILKKYACLLLAAALAVGATACGPGKEAVPEEKSPIRLTGELVPMASYLQPPLNMARVAAYALQGDKALYLENVRDENTNRTSSTLYRVSLDGTGTPEALYTGMSEEHSVSYFTLGRDDSLYLLEQQYLADNSSRFFLRKLNSDLEEVYLTAFEPANSAKEVYPEGMFESGDGSLVFYDDHTVTYFFDPEGNFVGHSISGLNSPRLVDGGEAGVFLVGRDSRDSMTHFLFRRMDLSTGEFSEEESIDLSGVDRDIHQSLSVISGYEKGILVSSENALFSYDYATGEAEKIFDWRGAAVNVDGSCIQEVRFLQEDFPREWLNGYDGPVDTKGNQVDPAIPADLPTAWEACSYDIGSGEAELIRFSYLDMGYLPEKQTITLGVSYGSRPALNDMVDGFNRTHLEYEVKVKEYESAESFALDLVLNHSEVPDLLDISWLNKEMLAGKGLLEDLAPYFKDSDVVRQEDILEAVWDACEEDGRVDSVIPAFSVRSLISSAQTLPPGEGWSYDQFFGLADDYPDSFLFNVYNRYSVWNRLSSTLDSFIDWKKGKCSFDSPEFVRMIEGVKGLPYPENQEHQTTFHPDQECQKLCRQDFLLYDYAYSSPYFYNQIRTYCGEEAWDVGFPTLEGELCYILQPLMQFSVYADSPVKDGAWAFIEFILSEEEQSWYSSELSAFPVQTDAFETYLTRPWGPVYNTPDNVQSPENAAALREMVNHLRLDQNRASGQISIIMDEETEAFFAGDKTAEQCADTIQNRVQLYLDENF